MSASVRRRRLVAALVLAVVAIASMLSGAAVVLARKGTPPPPRRAADVHLDPRMQTLSIGCKSPALGGVLPAEVYLPPDYNPRGRRYAVVYFLHGLPAGPTTYQQNAFVAQELAAAGHRAIVVAPQGARTNNGDREYLDWDAREDWPQAIAQDLPGCIDTRYHTIPSRYGRALMGLSAGGYGAFNIGLRNLKEFAAIESWSGYFVATDPTGYHDLALGSPQAQAAATVPHGGSLRRHLSSWPTLLGFYVGLQDSRFLGMNQQFDAALRRSGIKHEYAAYQGGHTYALWASHAPQWISMALTFLAEGRQKRAAAGA